MCKFSVIKVSHNPIYRDSTLKSVASKNMKEQQRRVKSAQQTTEHVSTEENKKAQNLGGISPSSNLRHNNSKNYHTPP